MPLNCEPQDFLPFSTDCNTPITISLFALSCVGISISIQDAPCRGTATVLGNTVVYAPCANFVGPDNFTYKLIGATDTGIRTIEVNVNGDNCNYYEVHRCNAPASERRWVNKAAIGSMTISEAAITAGNANVFKFGTHCYAVVKPCTTCPEGPILATIDPNDITWLVSGCCETDCPPTCCARGNCCFSDQTIVRLTVAITYTNPIPFVLCPCMWDATTGRTVDLPFVSCGAWGNDTCELLVGNCNTGPFPFAVRPIYAKLTASWNPTTNKWGVFLLYSTLVGGTCTLASPCAVYSFVSTTGDCSGGTVVYQMAGPPSDVATFTFTIQVLNNACCKCVSGNCRPMTNGMQSPADGVCPSTMAQNKCCPTPP
jgi:hypothetical protein